MILQLEGVPIRVDLARKTLLLTLGEECVEVGIGARVVKGIALSIASQVVKANEPEVRPADVLSPKVLKRRRKGGFRAAVSAPKAVSPKFEKVHAERRSKVYNLMKRGGRGYSSTELRKELKMAAYQVLLGLQQLVEQGKVFRAGTAPRFARYGVSQEIADKASREAQAKARSPSEGRARKR